MTSVTGETPAANVPSVSVIVTVWNDPRLARTLESILAQSLPASEILIADGGGSVEMRAIAESFHARDPRVRHVPAPGTIAETRNVVVRVARGELVAFLDTDEVAPPEWLAVLTRPFSDPRVGFTGGPTPAMPGTSRTLTARYYDGYLRRFYDRVSRVRPHAIPMGNSAWRRTVFDQLGPLLDLSLSSLGIGSIGEAEDMDYELRALAAGWQGVYVPEAAVLHDFSDIRFFSFLRKQRRYAAGGFLIWRRYRATYEASAARVLPFGILPLVVLAGLVLLPFPATRLLGGWVAIAGALGLGALALALTVQGLRDDRQYPGYRYRALEIFRRWATMAGAVQGWLILRRTRKAAPASAGGPASGTTGGKP
ncbi:MAG TPA: glycosyltransferase [Thermoplasmata archaeon]|nr:glycosyltransferase [Thermoplasmata archaeon]